MSYFYRTMAGTHCGSSYQNPPILQKQLIINPYLTIVAQITHHIPVQTRLVNPTPLSIARAQSQVYRTSHLLIEQRIPGASTHPRLIPKSELTQAPHPRIQFEHLLLKSFP